MIRITLAALLLVAGSVGVAAQETVDNLKIYFATGSASVRADQEQFLDQAARLYREGNPIVMVVAGGADTVGDPAKNLQLSIERALAVAQGLADRGIPIGRLQVLGRGNSELEVETEDGVDNAENRVAVIIDLIMILDEYLLDQRILLMDLM